MASPPARGTGETYNSRTITPHLSTSNKATQVRTQKSASHIASRSTQIGAKYHCENVGLERPRPRAAEHRRPRPIQTWALCDGAPRWQGRCSENDASEDGWKSPYRLLRVQACSTRAPLRQARCDDDGSTTWLRTWFAVLPWQDNWRADFVPGSKRFEADLPGTGDQSAKWWVAYSLLASCVPTSLHGPWVDLPRRNCWQQALRGGFSGCW